MVLTFEQDLDQGGDQILETVNYMHSGDFNITRYGGEDENDSANWSKGPEEAHVIPRPIILAFERLWREQFSNTVGFSMKWDFERPNMLYVEFELAEKIRDRARYICLVATKLSKWAKELAE
jgi:hypothetical protein